MPDIENLEILSICAIRYCLGRMSYMPSMVQGIVAPMLGRFSLKSLKVIARDIREQGGANHYERAYGMECDYRDWMKFLGKVNRAIEERKSDGGGD